MSTPIHKTPDVPAKEGADQPNPAGIWIGGTSQGALRAERIAKWDPKKVATHEQRGMGGNRFRYVEGSRRAYWSREPSADEIVALNNFLSRRHLPEAENHGVFSQIGHDRAYYAFTHAEIPPPAAHRPD